MTVADLSIEECCDRLTIFDGYSIQSQVLSDLTGQNLTGNAEITSSSNNLCVRFSSDCSLPERGFLAVLSPVLVGNDTKQETTTPNNEITENPNNNLTCGGFQNIYTDPYFDFYSITSPGYPQSSYLNNQNCEWRLQIRYSGYVIRLDVLELQLEYCSNGCDYIDVHDGISSSDRRIVRLSRSNQASITVLSTGPYMYLNFKTDSSVTDRGFRFLASALAAAGVTTFKPGFSTKPEVIATQPPSGYCGGLGTTYYIYPHNTYVIITSPGRPSYPNDLNCRWTLEMTDYRYILQLEVISFELELCCDYVDLFDGPSSNSTKLARLSSSNEVGRVFFSTGQYLFLNFRTDSSVTYSGFEFHATPIQRYYPSTTVDTVSITKPELTTQTSVCKDVQHLEANFTAFFIFSPGYPDTYSNNLDCEWSIATANSGYIVQLTVVDIDLESCCDYVDVYDGSTTSSPKIMRLTNQYLTLHSSGNYMSVHFHTDLSITRKGFKLSYTLATISTPFETISSTAPKLTTQTSLAITDSEGSSYWPFCQSDLPHEYASRDYARYIQSPGFPDGYNMYMACKWLIQTPYNGDVINLTVVSMSTELNGDYLSLYDGRDTSYPRIATLSGDVSLASYYSTGYQMYLLFAANDFRKDNEKGFSVSFVSFDPDLASLQPTTAESTTKSPVCGDIQHLEANFVSSYISSPGYPNSYSNNLDCDWSIATANSSYIVQLTVVDIDLESCCDYVDVYDGSTTSSPKIMRLTNQYKTLHSSGNYMYIRFHTDYSITYKGFKLSYTIATLSTTTSITTEISTGVIDTVPACSEHGDHLHINNDDNDFFESPNYPKYYYPNANCSWFIHGLDDAVRLVSEYMDLSYGDRLVIYDGSSPQAQVLETINGRYWLPVTVQSTGPDMFINFLSDDLYESQGFRFQYETMDHTPAATSTEETPTTSTEETTTYWPTCSGTTQFFASSHSSIYLQSPGYPNGYGIYLSCRWLILAVYGERINFTVRSMNTELGGDFLRLYDGLDFGYPLIAELSGNVSRRVFYSTGDKMYVQFISNGVPSTAEQTGVLFSVTTTQARPVTAQPTAEVTSPESQTDSPTCHYPYLYAYDSKAYLFASPGYPDTHPANMECFWTIESLQPYLSVQLSIIDIDLHYPYDSIYVYDGANSFAPVLRSFVSNSYAILYSTGPSMFIIYKTEFSHSSRGFQASYSSLYRQSCLKESAPQNATSSDQNNLLN